MTKEMLSSDWEISQGNLQPIPVYVNRLNTFLSQRGRSDIMYRFKYAERYQGMSTFVHESRMEWVGGPFGAMSRHNFSEQRTKIVLLSEDDDPEAFRVVRDFLYAKRIPLSAIPFSVLLRVALAAHRWLLTPLFSGILHFMESDGLLRNQISLLESVCVFSLPRVPRRVLLYFWHCVGINFGNFGYVQDGDFSSSQVETANISGLVQDTTDVGTNGPSAVTNGLSIEAKFCPRFPNLWALALSHDLVEVALESILREWTDFDGFLLDVILQYLEPRIKEDEVVCRLISQLGRKSEILETKLEHPTLDGECSSRAVRLLAKSWNRIRNRRQEMRYSWTIDAAKEQSFEREVFFCPDISAASNVVDCDITERASKMLKSANRNAQVGRKRPRPSKYDLVCESSLRLTLSVACNRNEILVLVRWEPGIVFTECNSTLEVLVEVMDDGCAWAADGSSYSAERACLRREMSATAVHDDGLLKIRLDGEFLESYRKAHGPQCAITILLHVKLLPA